MDLYRLDIHKNTIPCSWDEWSLMSWDDKIVKKDQLGGVEVSTVFLGMDHSNFRGSKPILFETMIFGGENDGYQKRYGTWDDALKGHLEACQLADWVSNERERKLGDLGI